MAREASDRRSSDVGALQTGAAVAYPGMCHVWRDSAQVPTPVTRPRVAAAIADTQRCDGQHAHRWLRLAESDLRCLGGSGGVEVSHRNGVSGRS